MSYVYTVGQSVDELKSWDPLVTAHNTHVLSVLAIRHPDSV